MDEYLKGWLDKAARDMKAVEHEMSFSHDEWLADVICFHCQQAVEKYLKALLIANQSEPPKTHNIELLVEQCAAFLPGLSDLDMKDLSLFGVDIRYPGDFYLPTKEEVEYYSSLATRIRDLVLKSIRI